MLELKSYKRWVLDTLCDEHMGQVVEVSLPAVVPIKVLTKWHSRYWGLESLSGYRAYYLFQPVVYERVRALSCLGVCFGELCVDFKFVSYLGLLAVDSNRWVSWIRCIVSTWKLVSGLTSSKFGLKPLLKVCLRDVYENYVDACGFSVFVTDALKACYGNFDALNVLLALLSVNASTSNKPQLYAIKREWCSRLAYLYSAMSKESSGFCGRRSFELAKLKLLKTVGIVPLYKLNMFKRLLALDLDLISTLAVFGRSPKYSRAWLSLKRLRDSLSALELDVKHVCWLAESAKTECDLMFEFCGGGVGAVGEGWTAGVDVVTSSLVCYSE
ncbi:hypothetical protein AADW59_00055 [Candidatus Hodgkinia cicadicola]